MKSKQDGCVHPSVTCGTYQIEMAGEPQHCEALSPRLFPFECCAFLCLLLSPCFLSNKASALYSSFLITKAEELFVSLVVG